MRGIIVAEYRDPLPAEFSSTATTFTGTAGLSTCFDWQAVSRGIRTMLTFKATAASVFGFICLLLFLFRIQLWPSRKLVGPRSLLTWLRRIILKKLGHSFLQVLVVLVRVCLEIDGLDGVAAPDQLFFPKVIQVHQQYPDGN